MRYPKGIFKVLTFGEPHPSVAWFAIRVCVMRLRSAGILLPLLLGPCSAMAAEQACDEVVKALVGQDRDATLGNKLPAKPDDFMRQRFTTAFNASWANAMSHNQEEPVLDGDVITGSQTVKRVLLKSLAKSENGDFGFVSTNIVYFDDEGPKRPHKQTVRFFLKKEGGVWKVDDINAGEQTSIRSYFKKSYGK